jgi:hypothetical protein
MEGGAIKDSNQILRQRVRSLMRGDEETWRERFAEALHSKICAAVLACHQVIAGEI